MIPFRPTSVEKWTRCPQKWYYEDIEGWRPAIEDIRPEMDLGTALHAGMATYWNRKLSDDSLKSPEQAARDSLYKSWRGDEVDLPGMLALIEQVTKQTCAWCETHMSRADPIMVEQSLGSDGKTTPDLVTREPEGLTVTDWKYHHFVKPEHMIYRLDGAERSHQFQHYIWAVGEYLGEPVRQFRAVHMTGLPKPTTRATTFEPEAEAQKEWLRQAKVKWATMQKMAAMGSLHGGIVYRNENGCKPFGDKWPCPMWAACWECHGNREYIERFYVKKGTMP